MEGHGVVHPGTALPPPDRVALEHCRRLQALLHDEIAAAGGAIGFERYMDLALYAPGLGYYSAGARKLGVAGDFVTAPEISPLFSRCVATQCAQVLHALGGGTILELGAGSGVMACDLLMELARTGVLPDAYLVLEVSADLRERQRQRVAALEPAIAARVQWLDGLPAAPLRGVILANEVLDALPVARLRVRHGVARELAVASDGDGFRWLERHCRAEPPGEVAALLARCQDGYTTEYCPALSPWLGTVAGVLGRGMALFMDYGYPRREYYHPQRGAGTLLCHYRHRVHDDPFLWPGLQDITASVDFTAVAEAAVAAGLAVRGFTTQAQFLVGTGLAGQVATQGGEDVRARAVLAREVQVLTLPGEMGEVFKVMAAARDFAAPLAGFSGPDHRHGL